MPTMLRFIPRIRCAHPGAWIAILILLPASVSAQEPPLPAQVEFNRDIRPILSDTCFTCHGPDTAKRKAKLRLDDASAHADRGGYRAIAPGKVEQSEIWKRIHSNDPEERMPPAKFGRQLTPRQTALLKRWIEQGAQYQVHWSLLPPQRPALPPVKNAAWPRNNIDRFVLAKLEAEGLQPSPAADPATLLRRLSLDLTGLPPTPQEIADCGLRIADSKQSAIRNPQSAIDDAVDRLLASPRYGERMAIRWLEAARYADTNGYQSDNERTMWRWRDWVIEAYNSNMRFDQFTIEQLAGDMLPNATLDQKIATGFNRNHRGNAEGGVIPAEYAVEYVVDRVDTTMTVWLGLTAGCARCHDHKYDPLAQKEFYQLFAYFNNVPEKGKAVKYGNSPPYLKTPTRVQQEELRRLRTQLDDAQKRWDKLQPAVDAAQAEWEAQQPTLPADWSFAEDQNAHFALDDLTSARNSTAQPSAVPGRHGGALAFAGKQLLDLGNAGDFGFADKFAISLWLNPTSAADGTILSRMLDTDRAEGYCLRLEKGVLHLDLCKRWLDDALRVALERQLPLGRWQHVLVTYDGSRMASGVRIYLDGEAQPLKILLDDLNQTFQVDAPLRLGAGGENDLRFHGALDEVRLFKRVLTPAEVSLLATADPLAQILALPRAKRSPAQVAKLRYYYLYQHASMTIRLAYATLRAQQQALARLDDSIPTTMVMEEMNSPRPTHLLLRGEYDKLGPRVFPGLPAALPPLPAGAPNNRLGFAQWLVDPQHPLTARVAVNRLWQMLFGTGLVKSTEDFGSQGEWPSHPELLDYLATEYIRTGWDTKALLKQIVTSATYRQSSKLTPALWQRDPENRLLARGPRYRLPVEMIRDQALAISGLLVEQQGGPSVKTYQPAGIWKDLAGLDYVADKGASLYRRTLYTFWKRTIAPPNLLAFDAAAREACVVRESRTNTPLQALNLLNDVTYVEASRMLAQRLLREGGPTARERLTFGFRLATARAPRPQELQILEASLQHQQERFGKDRAAALQLLSVGEAPRNLRLDPVELAAYTAVANLLLNLDETITKQ